MTGKEQRYESGPERPPKDRMALHRRRLVRRKFLKLGAAGGAALVASLYAKPSLRSIGAAPAYAQGTPLGDEGCTPGYWKNLDPTYWPSPYNANPTYSSVFTVPSAYTGSLGGTKKLLDVLMQGGGCEKALGRHSVAALLNAAGLGGAAYGESAAAVIARVNTALASLTCSPTIETEKNYLQGLNEQGCPLTMIADP